MVQKGRLPRFMKRRTVIARFPAPEIVHRALADDDASLPTRRRCSRQKRYQANGLPNLWRSTTHNRSFEFPTWFGRSCARPLVLLKFGASVRSHEKSSDCSIGPFSAAKSRVFIATERDGREFFKYLVYQIFKLIKLLLMSQQ